MSLLSRIAVEAARGFGALSAKAGVSANFLVIAGGGSGGKTTVVGGAGGGAGGFRTSAGTSGGGASAESAITLSTLTTYTITVGAGGAAAIVQGVGNSGSNSSLSGTGLTTITSTGGGGGDSNNAGVISGGSGGGGANPFGGSGGAGTANQGFAGGGTVASSGYQIGGGGGGAGAVGGNGTSSGSTGVGGNGGAGVASSISGSSVTYAGGGGGTADTRIGATQGTGGAGGGGNGSATTGVSGTVNLGAGGGGAGSGNSGAGGSGIVIISYTSATPKFIGGTLTTSGGNQIHTFTSSGSLSPLTPVTASYLVVAGGAGGGGATTNQGGGGGGAGGLLTSSTTLYSGATYVVTVGAGGTGGVYGGAAAGTGSNSVVSGTGLTTITSSGGGGGGVGPDANGSNGGSGGGGGSGGTLRTGGTGTVGQGNNGGQNNGNANYAAGGGGGAGAVGGDGGNVGNGNGGNGSASSISGSSITYAGGGGAGKHVSASAAGTGGTGGGGAGGSSSVGVSGTTNLGGGGGGGSSNNVGGSGGSGTVIISYAGSQVFNGGLVTSSGGNTIHTFNATGALTPLTNNLTNSLRFRSSASAYLNRTPTLAGSRTTWTWSAWVKRGSLSVQQAIFFAGNVGTGSNYTNITFNTNDTLVFENIVAGVGSPQLITTQVFRDSSAWYHIVAVYDSTQATSSNRAKLYINGTQVTTFGTATYPSLNQTSFVNSTEAHLFGASRGPANYFDGYMDDINFIDGQALEPYYFGNNDANGVWKPIKYTGMYGTNGFYLTFADTTSTTTLGYDSSGNNNNWTTNNISLTAGVTYDAMLDVPTNTSATVANYAVLNPLITGNVVTPTNANLTSSVSAGTNAYFSSAGTIAISTGKWYWECSITARDAGAGQWFQFGIVSSTTTYSNNAIGYSGNMSNAYAYYNDGSKAGNGTGTAGYGATFTTSDIIGIAFDSDAGTITFYKNNVSQGQAFSGISSSLSWLPIIQIYGSTGAANTVAINFGQRPFAYTPPTGFVALNTFNLPTPTILQGNKYMDATLWTGNGSTQVVTNQSQFKPDLVWIKGRNTTFSNVLYDSIRGATNYLVSNDTAAQVTDANSMTAFNSNGFSVGSSAFVNGSGATQVGWQWQAGQGTNTSNTSGSITSTTSVNTTAGFSIATFSSTSTNATIGHGLGVAPKMIIVKGRNNVQDWYVYNANLGAGKYILLNGSGASITDIGLWQNTAPTSSVFYIGSGFGTINYLAYCWAEIAGFSRFGSYTGNGNVNGPFVYLGFRPEFVMVKGDVAGVDWVISDSSRNTFNVVNRRLFPASTGAEDAGDNWCDFLSNGFKIRSTNTNQNFNGQTFIYMAFAENPFKNANAR